MTGDTKFSLAMLAFSLTWYASLFGFAYFDHIPPVTMTQHIIYFLSGMMLIGGGMVTLGFVIIMPFIVMIEFIKKAWSR